MISIIIPLYNKEKYVQECLESCINQSYEDVEIVVVDDCSTDVITKEVLSGIGGINERIRVLSTKVNSGAGVARNVGLDNAQNSYVAFCDADDWWYPEKLEKQMLASLDLLHSSLMTE